MRKLGTVLCVVGLAVPGVAAAAPDSPAWCKDAKSNRDILSRALTDENPDMAVPAIVEMLCFPDKEAKEKRGELEARRQYWLKRLAMTEADWAADVPEWAAVSYSIRNTPYIAPAEGEPWSKAGPVEQWALLSMRAGKSNAFSLTAGGKSYLSDALPLTQAARVALIDDCIHTNSDSEVKPIEWAVCQPDIDALDPARFGAELRADKERSGYERMVVRTEWARLAPKLVEHATKVKKLVARDEVYGKLFEIARATHKEWAENPHTQQRAELLVYEDAYITTSRKALAGCSEKTWPVFAALAATVTAADVKGGDPLDQLLGTVLRTPDGYFAGAALVACEGHGTVLHARIGGILSAYPGYRGPHAATLTKLAIANLQPDRKSDALDYDIGGRHFALGETKYPGSGSVESTVAAVKDQGDVVRVEFVKSHELQTFCAEWRDTGKLVRIDSNGVLRYESVCVSRETVDADTTPAPVTIGKRFAAGIGRGTKISVSQGIPIAVWKSPKDKTPTHVAGFALK